MPDLHCPACGEPSDVHHVRHDMTAPLPRSTWEGPARDTVMDSYFVMDEVEALLPASLPADLRDLTLGAIRAELAMENLLRQPVRPIPDAKWNPIERRQQTTAEAWRAEMYRVGLRYGCDCCLLDPVRRTHREAYLERALFDSAFDGDPAELLS